MSLDTICWFALVSLFFAVFSLFRNTISLGLLERPLVIGLFWGTFSKDYVMALNISIFFELFWLDLIPAGTFIPPHLTASTFAALSLVTFLDITAPAQIMVVIFCCMPLAWLGAQLEAFQRDKQRKSYNQLLNWSRKPSDAKLPGMLIARSALITLTISWSLFLVAVLALYKVMNWLLVDFSTLIQGIDVSWPHLWIAATLGGVMALRLKRAYVVLTIGICFVLFFSIWTGIAWQSS